MPGQADAAAAILQTLFGGKQLGSAAPAFQPGTIPGSLFQGPLAGMQNGSGLDLLNSLSNQGQTAVAGPNATQAGQMGPPEAPAPQMGPPALPTESGQKPGFFDSFFGSLDQSLQSPAKLLGVGLLNQMGYPLGTAGLLGKGLFDAFKR